MAGHYGAPRKRCCSRKARTADSYNACCTRRNSLNEDSRASVVVLTKDSARICGAVAVNVAGALSMHRAWVSTPIRMIVLRLQPGQASGAL